ncbi:SRPBCC family protein [Alsobacter sp. KACC 23698]|uniref:SRPBCC family protein n=1 Tax=Alsobacter sp. KACC 23698 TaxID=3149229 RepID=A0AAU7JFK6_9HYPH
MHHHEIDPASLAQPVGTDAIRIERLLPGPRERVWRYLTEPDLRRKWLAAGAFDLAPGGAIELVFHNNALTPNDEPPPAGSEAHGEVSRLRGTVLACEKPSLLAFTWGTEPDSSQVRFELADEGGKVRLTVTHSRVVKPGMVVSVSAGWHCHLDLLASELEGRAPVGFWRSIRAVRPTYERRAASA